MADLLEWASRAGVGAVVELVCQEAAEQVVPLAGGTVVIRLTSCIDRAPLALPYEIVARGVARVVVRVDACPTPDSARATAWEGMIAAYGADRLSVLRTPPETGQGVEPLAVDRLPRLTRRGVFGLLAPAAPERAEPVLTEHQRLRRALSAAVAAGVAVDAEAAGRAGVGLVLEAPTCALDAVCAATCTEGALVIERSGDRSTLLLDPGACTGCGLCLRACPTEALRVRGPADWAAVLGHERLTVAGATTRTCERCQARHSSRGSQSLCPTCAFRRANPFSSALPEEMRGRRRFGAD